jgi:lysyl-tRNA synthetase class 2
MTTVRGFFEARSYLEVETPILVPSPGLDLHLDAFAVEGGGFLITSPEYQMKRLLAEGFDRIFQIVKCFRRGELGSRHNPEFTMLEWYAANMAADDMMSETEALVRGVLETHGHPPLPPFERLTVCDAYAQYAGVQRDELLEIAADDEDRYFTLLVDEVEPALSQRAAPVFLCDYPSSQASLARPKPDDADLCERFELYFRGIELCNGFGELTDPVEQRARFLADQQRRREHDKPAYPIDDKFLAALEAGMPSASGNALGLDRLIAICAGTDNIADVMTFGAGTV